MAADIDRLMNVLEDEGPSPGILGFSHGADLAATVLANHIRISKAAGRTCMFKMALFLCGIPPHSFDGKGRLLFDEVRQVFDLPTCHVIGASDHFIEASMALYNLCDPDTAVIFDHGKGHQLVWDPKKVSNLTQVVRQMVQQVEKV